MAQNISPLTRQTFEDISTKPRRRRGTSVARRVLLWRQGGTFAAES